MDGSTQPSPQKHQHRLGNHVREKVYEDENGYVLVDHFSNIQKAALHLHFNEGAWTLGKYKKYLVIFESILASLKDKCYTEIYATPLESDVKAQKLIAMFGFEKISEKHGLVVMKRKV